MRTLSQNWQNWVVAALAATWLAAQNVGIGTTTPLTRLHVAAGDIFLGEAAGANGFILHARDWAGYDFLQISTRTTGSYEWGKGITLVRSSGNVGIGTTGPEGSLDVARGAGEAQANATSGSLPYGTEKADLILERLHSPTKSLNGYPASLIDLRARNTFGNTWSVAQILGVADLNVGGGYAGGLAFLTSPGGNVDPAGRRTIGSAPVTRMVIDANGNVGIGTTAPQNRLHVSGGEGRIISEGTWPGVWMWSTQTAARAFVGSVNANNDIGFWTSGADWHLVMLQNGNVGIGTTAPHSAAILQLQATNKGFLPTQVALTSATSWSPLVGSSVDGMLVYNTNTAGTGQDRVSPGYYYWRAGRWRRLSENGYDGMIQGVLYTGQQNLTSNCPTNQYLNSYIDLPPGKWIVYSIQLLKPTTNPSTTGAIWVVTTFSDNTSCSPRSPDIIGSPLMSGLLPNQTWHSLLIGQVIINNTSGGVKRYYYCGCKESYFGYNAGLIDFSTTTWGESQLYALPAE